MNTIVMLTAVWSALYESVTFVLVAHRNDEEAVVFSESTWFVIRSDPEVSAKT